MQHFRTVVINMEHPAFDRGLAQELGELRRRPLLHLAGAEGRGAAEDRAPGTQPETRRDAMQRSLGWSSLARICRMSPVRPGGLRY